LNAGFSKIIEQRQPQILVGGIDSRGPDGTYQVHPGRGRGVGLRPTLQRALDLTSHPIIRLACSDSKTQGQKTWMSTYWMTMGRAGRGSRHRGEGGGEEAGGVSSQDSGRRRHLFLTTERYNFALDPIPRGREDHAEGVRFFASASLPRISASISRPRNRQRLETRSIRAGWSRWGTAPSTEQVDRADRCDRKPFVMRKRQNAIGRVC